MVAGCMHHGSAGGTVATVPSGDSIPDDVSQSGTPLTVRPRMQRAISAELRMSK